MENILDLLTEKNHFLERFHSLNEKEILNFVDGNFDNLDEFYNNREKVLAIIAELDKKIETETSFGWDTATPQNEVKVRLVKALDYKNEIVTRILAQDLQILSIIENAKSMIIKELSQVKASRKVIGSYRSGTKARNKVDEKA